VNAHRDQRLEQAGGIVPVGNQVEIDEDGAAGPSSLQLLDHRFDRLLEWAPAPRSGHDAKRTVVHAAARRLEDVGGEVSPLGKH
jgi:hypothetical protein